MERSSSLFRMLQKALESDRFLDVSHLDAMGKGSKMLPRNPNDLPAVVHGHIRPPLIGLTNVPDFPIVSNNAQGWNLALNMLANQSTQPDVWYSLIGSWGRAVPEPGLYNRQELKHVAFGYEKLI